MASGLLGVAPRLCGSIAEPDRLPGGQGVHAMTKAKRLDLLHDTFALARLDMRDVHVDRAFQAFELSTERGRAQVLTDAGELVLPS